MSTFRVRHPMPMFLAKMTHIFWFGTEEAPERVQRGLHKVGEYEADYSKPDIDEWRAVDPELEALLAKSESILDSHSVR